MLITGGADYLARIWNPYVTQKSIALLEGHHAAVIDVKINDRLQQCYTFSKDAVRHCVQSSVIYRLMNILRWSKHGISKNSCVFKQYQYDLRLH
jgi:hypothetical protein